jgi:hypothetical protein
MARTVAPHGTEAAYARHRRAGEPACAECLEAVRQARRDSRGDERAEAIARYKAAQEAEPLVVGVPDDYAETLDSYRTVRAAILDCHPSAVVGLSREWERLVERLVKMQDKRTPTLVEQIAQRRSDRLGL